MDSLVGCFVVTPRGKLFRVVDIWNGDDKASPEVLLESLNDPKSADFKWTSQTVLKSMEVVGKSALEG